MKNLVEYNLFNAADNQLMPYLNQDDFNKSLLFNVLFQDKLLVPEPSFFNSYFLANHIRSSRAHISLFEAASMEGIILPTFRNEKINTLRESYAEMQLIYGKDYNLIHEAYDSDSLARMKNSVDLGRKKQGAFYWPKDIIVGEKYYDVLKSFLQRKELPSYISEERGRHSKLKKYWELTQDWRFVLIDEAAKKTIEKGSLGVQKAEITKLVCEYVGLPVSIALNASDSISKYINDPETKKLVDVFIKWIAQCHHLNMARVFGSSLTFPAYNSNEDFMCDSIARAPIDSPITKQEGFKCSVNLPPIEALLTLHPSNLISIRNELGYSYLIALREWQEFPGDNNMANVISLLQKYCERICEWYPTRNFINVKAQYSVGANVKREGFDFCSNLVGALSPIGGIFMALLKFGYAVYQYHSELKENTPIQKSMEVNLRESLKDYNKIL